jgi:hypothetical protein
MAAEFAELAQPLLASEEAGKHYASNCGRLGVQGAASCRFS